MGIYNLRFEVFQACDGLWSVTLYCNSDHLHTAVSFADAREAEIYGGAFIAGLEFQRWRATNE